MEKKSENFSIEQALRAASSPAGQQLLALLRQTNGDALQKAAALAAAGDLESAGRIVNAVLSGNEKAQNLAKELGK